ncbi:MAG: peptide chain release factor 1, partial [Thermofilum sp. ex4484_15]
EKLEIYVLEPPQKLTTYLYRCDSIFHTEILEDMIEVKESYGLIAMDRSEATIAVLRGKSVEIVDRVTSGVPGKHKAGGQSARRFARIIEQMAHEYYKRVGEHANKVFLQLNDLAGIIVGGPGPTKEEFVRGDYLHYELKNKVLAVLDIGYSGEEGIYELLKASGEVLKNVEYFKEKREVQEFLYHVVNDTGLATYGEREVRRALELGAVSKLLLSSKLGGYRVEAKCNACSHKFSRTVRELSEIKCPKCGGNVTVLRSKPLIEDLIELAERTGAEVRIISSNTEEGEALKKSFGGIAAILRFKVEI